MKTSIGKALEWLRRRAENFIAALLAVMFVAFLVQILFRYVLNFPVGWTTELTIITWMWIVLFGAAFVLGEGEEIRFDLIYGAAGPRTRRVMGIIIGFSIVILYGVSFPATVDYVTFMKVEATTYLKIRFDYLYSIYLLFAVAIIVRYVWILWELIRGVEAKELESPTLNSDG